MIVTLCDYLDNPMGYFFTSYGCICLGARKLCVFVSCEYLAATCTNAGGLRALCLLRVVGVVCEIGRHYMEVFGGHFRVESSVANNDLQDIRWVVVQPEAEEGGGGVEGGERKREVLFLFSR